MEVQEVEVVIRLLREDEGDDDDDDVAESNFPLRNPLAPAVLLLSLPPPLLRSPAAREILSIHSNLLPFAQCIGGDPYCFLPTDTWLANDRDILPSYLPVAGIPTSFWLSVEF